MNTIIEDFKNNVKDYPEKPVLIFGDEIISYKRLDELINSLSISLSNLKKGSIISIFLENSVDYVVSYLGILNAGMIAHLIPTNLSDEKIIQQLNNANPDLIISSNSLIDKIKNIRYDCKKVITSELICNESVMNDYELAENDISYLIYTSGTTGEPKGVPITHANVNFTTRNIINELDYNSSDINILPLPLSHSFGLGCLHASLSVGSTLVLLKNAGNTMNILESIKKNNATTLAVVPLTLNKILKEHENIYSDYIGNLRLIMTNSTSIPVDTVKNYRTVLKNGKIATYYGLTEASRSTFMIFDQLGREESVGKPPHGIEIRIKSESSNELESGEILIKGKNVINHYWKNEQEDKIIDGWIHTGDIGHKDADGYLYLDGRLDGLINIAGEKVMAEEIEKVVRVLTGVEDIVVVGMKNEMFGQIIKAFVKKSINNEITKSEILSYCIKNLESFKVPREIEFIKDFPRNEFGKIQRFRLE
jgi:long-chain acyl-CoA synthetase